MENELAALQAIQAEMSRTQNTNWAITQEQFDIYADNFNILRDCDQLLFANQQLNFNFDTISSLLAMIHASVKSFRMNLLNSIPVLLQGHFPMSLNPMESLLVILDHVAFQQAKAADRLSLAIPTSDLLSYYDSRLLADAVTISEGLLLTLNIPLASKQTVFVLYEAKTISMPYPDDPQLAITWKLEATYLALSDDHMESSVLSKDQFEQCLGSSKYRICSKTFTTELGHSSCIASLFFDTSLEALSVCETNIIINKIILRLSNMYQYIGVRYDYSH